MENSNNNQETNLRARKAQLKSRKAKSEIVVMISSRRNPAQKSDNLAMTVAKTGGFKVAEGCFHNVQKKA